MNKFEYCSCKLPSLAGMLNKYYQKQCSCCGGVIPELSIEDQHTLLKIKSLLNHMDYVIWDEHRDIVDDFHILCRKFCNWGK